jgi:acyl-CoA hydrolase
LLAWIDEASWIAASLDFPHCQFVTIGMDKVEFRHGVRDGAILRIESKQSRKGKSSVTYEVSVTDQKQPSTPPIFTTNVSFVSVNDRGEKREI